MCQPVSCRTCGKTTWTGCGQHVDQVMAKVPMSNRCGGHEDDPGGWLSRIFSR